MCHRAPQTDVLRIEAAHPFFWILYVKNSMVEEFIHCAYSGERSEVGPMEGNGEFTFPNGSKYVGEFLDGQFHGKGILYYPGRGRYEATWDHGKVVQGRLFFEDGLEHQKENWIYCSPEDRRYYVEVTGGLRPAGDSYITPTRREGQA